MASVRETRLPGVGIRYEFTTEEGQEIGVIVHHDGRREVLVYDQADPDACTTALRLTPEDTRVMGEVLGASQVSEAVGAVRQDIEGLAIEWIELPDDAPAAGSNIGDGQYRTRTGASLVAVIRGGQSVPAPGPEFVLAGGDVVVAVGTSEGLTALRDLLRP